jgi:hypothetical protein
MTVWWQNIGGQKVRIIGCISPGYGRWSEQMIFSERESPPRQFVLWNFSFFHSHSRWDCFEKIKERLYIFGIHGMWAIVEFLALKGFPTGAIAAYVEVLYEAEGLVALAVKDWCNRFVERRISMCDEQVWETASKWCDRSHRLHAEEKAVHVVQSSVLAFPHHKGRRAASPVPQPCHEKAPSLSGSPWSGQELKDLTTSTFPRTPCRVTDRSPINFHKVIIVDEC